MLWHQLDRVQTICTSLQRDNHNQHLITQLIAGRMLILTPNEQCQSTDAKIFGDLGPFPSLPSYPLVFPSFLSLFLPPLRSRPL